MDAATLANYKDVIEQRLAALEHDDALGQDGQAVVTLDQQAVGRLSRMDALQSQAMSKATQARRDALKRALRTALVRIREAESGYCDGCGEAIATARLDLDPTVMRCIGCASGRV